MVPSRLLPALAVPPLIAAGLGSRALLHGLPAKVLGDAFYCALVFALAVVWRPDVTVPRAAAIAIGLCFALEVAQLTGVPAWLSSKHVLLRLIFGTTFGFVDLAGYLLGGALAAAALSFLRLVRRRFPGRA